MNNTEVESLKVRHIAKKDGFEHWGTNTLGYMKSSTSTMPLSLPPGSFLEIYHFLVFILIYPLKPATHSQQIKAFECNFHNWIMGGIRDGAKS